VNQGTLTFHVWFSRIHNLDRPDFVLFDLDPAKPPSGMMVVAKRSTSACRRGSRLLREDIRQDGFACPGSMGIQWRLCRGARWARQLARAVVAELPEVATLETRKASRGGESMSMSCKTPAVTMRSPYVLRAVPQAASRPHWHGTS
jgi:bifunctional non-homologous end joining protein LigD